MLNERETANELVLKAIVEARIGEESDDIQSSLDASSVLAEIAEFVASMKGVNEGIALAESVRNPGKRDSALHRIRKMGR
ncbi:MAG: hypothetical protein IPK58_24570 [Acidobacteria bacterium]|nr:hypothetical protein [Acidobacteriota bacterium]